ncbi:MAG: CHAT domain-containing protein, partial [Saprospiraceae bacterium]|nr:CHAT domain-containing protein [Saprospiraceae bacterium]
ASDLYARSIKADLVVLSACETNKGRLRRGEGIMSFARGFSAAGVKSVLSTFWVIGEDPSLLIMKDFYAELNAGAAKDEALQKARAGLMDNSDFSHPFYWSAFVPIGQMSEVEAGSIGSWWIVGLMALLAFWLIKLPKFLKTSEV